MPFQPSKKKKHRKIKSVAGTLNLTSLIDIFIIILLFLLKNYSVESGILIPNPKLKLPVSTSRENPIMTLTMQISSDNIILNGENVAKVNEVLKAKDFVIKPLLEALHNNTKKTEFIAKNNPNIKFTGDVLIQGDKRIPFVLLEKVMFTCGQAGYGNISLAAITYE